MIYYPIIQEKLLMSANVKEITESVLALPKRSRAILAELILDTLDETSELLDNEQAWLDEAKKRDKEISTGKVKCRTHKEIVSAAYEAIGCKS